MTNDDFRKCGTCFTTDIKSWDPRNLVLTCAKGHRTVFSRKDVNSGVDEKSNNAIKSFCDKNYDLAEKLASEIVGVSYYHAPANFILAYTSEIIHHKYDKLANYFTEMEAQEGIDIKELEGLEQMIISAPQRLIDYETNILLLIDKNVNENQNEWLKTNMLKFMDVVCPYWISTRSSSDFLTPELAKIYTIFASHCTIPKTCYALYNAIAKIPDSPCVGGTFYLATKTRKFYENFVLPIGGIIGAMKDTSQRAKFSAAYENRKKQFEAKMQ